MAIKKQRSQKKSRKTAMKIFAAGGAVRDLLLGRPMHDVDFVFAATEEAFILRNPSACKTQEGAFPVYLLNGQEYSPLPRARSLAESLSEDLLRRDFTINALLLSENGVLHCHPLALADLAGGVIRPAAPTSLAENPIRVFRAARFAACLPDFSTHGETLAQMRALPSSLLAGIAAEQVGRETLKACWGKKPGDYLRTLHRGQCLEPWFTEFVKAGEIPAGPTPFHDDSVLEHTAHTMDRVAQQTALAWPGPENARNRSLAVWMALCHDLGKTMTPAELLPKHHGHDAAGVFPARELGYRLRLPNLYSKAGMLAAKLHMKAADYQILRPGTKVDLLMTLHSAHLTRPFLCMAAVDADQPGLPALMQHDLDCILAVSLPRAWQGRGPASGRHLRDLRCIALSKRISCRSNATLHGP